jgi:hypothetical protein
MRQPKFKQLAILGFELVLLALIVKGVARAWLEEACKITIANQNGTCARINIAGRAAV